MPYDLVLAPVPEPGLTLQLLGPFQLARVEDGNRIGLPIHGPTRKIESLLSYLALHHGTPTSRQQLAFILYPDSTDAQARTNLRTLLHRLRATLPDADRLLNSDAQYISWRSDAPITVDVIEFERAIALADVAEKNRDSTQSMATLERAAKIYQGDLLPDCYDDWIAPERERFQRSFMGVLERLVELCEQAREYGKAIAFANRLLSVDPFSETAYLTLLRSHAALGERGAALSVYHRCLTAFRQELDAEPSQLVRDTYAQLLDAEPETAPVLVPQAPLVGRDAEWQHLRTAWTRVGSGPAKLLLLTGEAGIGKTRLAEELLMWARRQGITTATAVCYASENTLPYAPVIAWLRSPQIVRARKRLETTWLKELLLLLPEIRDEHPDWKELPPLQQTWQRQRLLEALAHGLLASNQPLLLLIDDVQWGDRDTLEWLHFLIHFPGARLLILATARSDELDENSALVTLRDDLRHANCLSEIALGTLSRHDTFQLAQHLSAQALDAAHANRLFAETEGNPLFVVEMIRAGVAEDDPLAHDPVTKHPTSDHVFLPLQVKTVIERRFWRLSPIAHQVLMTAAVIGRSFTFDVLKRAARLDEESVARGLDELWQRCIVREQGTLLYDFTHDKLRAVAYAHLSGARRHILHRHVAEALEEVNARDLDSTYAQIALHYERAHELTHAIEMYRRAAEAAMRLYGNTDALENFECALAVLDRAELNLPANERQRLLLELSVQRGDVLFRMGRYDDARAAFQTGLDHANVTDASAHAELHRKLGNCARELHRYAAAFSEYDTAAFALGTEPNPARQQALIEIEFERFSVHYWLGNVREIQDGLENLHALVEQHATTQQRARYYQTLTTARMRLERYAVSSATVEAARNFLTLLQADGDSIWLQSAHFQLGFALLWFGDLDQAEREMLTAFDLAQVRGDTSLKVRCLTYLTVVHRLHGDLEHTHTYAEQALDLATRAQMYDYVGAAHGNRAWLTWRAGELQESLVEGQLALAAWQRLPNAYMFQWLALMPFIAVALQKGELEQALTWTLTLVQDSQQRMPDPLENLFASALTATENRDLAAARNFLEQSLALARERNLL